VTQVLVDRDDPEFRAPSKPIGTHMDRATAERLARLHGWTVREEPGRGWRRVVASPAPKRIVDLAPIRELLGAGFIVVACGGGGIPVVEDAAGDLVGVEAVIDKDFASAMLAHDLDAALFLIATEVERVAIDFGKPGQRWLDRLTVAEARRHLADGQFPKGSMGPKVEAILSFLTGGGREGLITNTAGIGRALRGETGTRFVTG
jgi:carbamate kinase